VDTCQLWVRAPSKAPVVSLSKKLYIYPLKCRGYIMCLLCFLILGHFLS